VKGILLMLLAGPIALAQEPVPRRPGTTTIPLANRVAAISGVRELPNGQLLLSDAKSAAVYLVDPASGRMKAIGSAGGDSLQYAQPGGFYAGPADTTFLLDRGLGKFLVISPSGAIVGSRSIKRKGYTYSSDEFDYQQLDRRGLSYFTNMTFSRGQQQHALGDRIVDSTGLMRFDAARQNGDIVAQLRKPESRVVVQTENYQQTQGVVGSPLDEWGVASDGRIAVVHGSPYRVDWIAPNGQVTSGPAYEVARITFDQAERDSITQAAQRGAGGVSVTGGPGGTSTPKAAQYFADFKAPFALRAVTVSPTGQVWVARTGPRGQGATIYDVFNGAGQRTDRFELPLGARIVGFGPNAAYATVNGNGSPTLIRIKTEP
jgi:hypothetical protein